MSTFTRRLQVLLDDQRYQRLEQLARARRTSVATLVREALDVAFPEQSISRADAGRRLLEAEQIPVGDWDELKTEVEAMYEPTR